MAFTEDLTVFFDAADHAVSATWTPAAGGGPFTIEVIFENGYREYELGEAGQAGAQPFFLVSGTQIAQGSGMKRGDTVAVNSVNYTVAQVEPDGTGVSRVWLRT